MTTNPQLKTCPFCAEDILAIATKCKHCRETFPAIELAVSELKYCSFCGEVIKSIAKKCKHCSSILQDEFSTIQTHQRSDIDTICTWINIDTILWIILGVIQIIIAIGIAEFKLGILGGWNIFAAISERGNIERVKDLDSTIPESYSGLLGIIFMGIWNSIFGGPLGIALFISALMLRNKILTNKNIFKHKLKY